MPEAEVRTAGRPALVTSLTWEAEEILSVTLTSTDGAPLPPWQPGAHIDLTLPNGLRRQYSVVQGAPDLSWYRVAVDRSINSRGGSEYVHLFLRPGQTVSVGGPRNHFALQDEPHWLFVSGGIGITPIVPMVEHARQAGVSWRLHYTGRRRGRMAFLELLKACNDPRISLHAGDADARLDLGCVLRNAPERSGVYVCGPERMLEHVSFVAAEQRPDLALHFERFQPRPKVLPPPRNFTAVAKRSGLTIPVPAHRSLQQELESRGVRIGSGCRNGLCGACEIPVLDGGVEHRDDVLTEAQREESAVMLACVSRAADEQLVLDV